MHFHATRDTLQKCPSNGPFQPGFGTTCWPPPEQPNNMETTLVGNLPLSSSDENDLVSFLDTLNDETIGPFP